MEGEPGGVEGTAQLPVADSPIDPDRTGSPIEIEDAGHPAHREEIARGVRDVVERVPGAEHP